MTARHIFRPLDRDVASICSGHLRVMSELRPAVRLESKSPQWSVAYHGPPRELERLFASLVGHLSRGALPSYVGEREDLLQPAQPSDRSSDQVPESRRRDR